MEVEVEVDRAGSNPSQTDDPFSLFSSDLIDLLVWTLAAQWKQSLKVEMRGEGEGEGKV